MGSGQSNVTPRACLYALRRCLQPATLDSQVFLFAVVPACTLAGEEKNTFATLFTCSFAQCVRANFLFRILEARVPHLKLAILVCLCVRLCCDSEPVFKPPRR